MQKLIAYKTLVVQALNDVFANGAIFTERVAAADDIEWVVEAIVDVSGGPDYTTKPVKFLVKFKGWKSKCAQPIHTVHIPIYPATCIRA